MAKAPVNQGRYMRSPSLRDHLRKELPSLPCDVAEGLDTLHMAMLCATWLDCDERLAARDYDDPK